MMSREEEFKILVDWHRDTQKRLGQLQVMVALLFAVVVVPAILKQLGITMWWM